MRNFVILFFLIFAGFNHLNFAHEHKDVFDSDACWSDMHNLAETRSQWFVDTIRQLTDTTLDLKVKVALTKKIRPDLNEADFASPTTRVSPTTVRLQKMKFVNGVTGDLAYSAIYWRFLERVIAFYNTAPNNTPEIRKAVLPHFVRELTNFDPYALEDLRKNSRARYFSEEFFVNRAIYQECEALANHYGIVIDKMMEVVDQETKEHLDLTVMSEAELASLTFSGESSKASKKLPYFMEQVIYFRRTSTFSTPMPDLNNAMVRAFQAYVLPATGPVFITPLPLEVATPAPALPEEKSVRKKDQKTSRKPKQSTKNLKSKDMRRKEQARTRTSPELKSGELKEVDSSDTLESKKEKVKFDSASSAEKKDVSPPSAASIPAISQQSIISPATAKAAFSLPPIIGRPTELSIPRKLTLRDVRFRIQHRNSGNFLIGKQVYNFPFRAKNPEYFDPRFLGDIKRMTHLSPRTEKLPNLAKAAITFVYLTGENEATKTIKFEELFLSGGKFFGTFDMNFKNTHKIINAMQDMLTAQEKEYIYGIPHGKKGVPLGIAMEKHLRRQIIEGPWKNNCVDSEAIFILHLVKNLPSLLSSRFLPGLDVPVVLKHAILSIDSYRDCCPNCQKLIQGFQWRLRDLILGYNIPKLTVAEGFGTLAIVKGHIPLQGPYLPEVHEVIDGPIDLEDLHHKLVCVSPDSIGSGI